MCQSVGNALYYISFNLQNYPSKYVLQHCHFADEETGTVVLGRTVKFEKPCKDVQRIVFY